MILVMMMMTAMIDYGENTIRRALLSFGNEPKRINGRITAANKTCTHLGVFFQLLKSSIEVYSCILFENN